MISEVDFYGINCNTDHTFSNTDKLMRERGFDLFNLDFKRYFSSKLPSKFKVDCLAQIIYGRIYQDDALYLIDPCSDLFKEELSIQKILKLCCLYQIFGVPCHSAELILKYKKELNKIIDINILLNILTNEIDSRFDNYNEYINYFKVNPTSFFPRFQNQDIKKKLNDNTINIIKKSNNKINLNKKVY